MAGRRLTRTVYLRGDDGTLHAFRPGDDVPGWAAERITNPSAWDGPADAPADDGDSKPRRRRSTQKSDTE